MAEIHPAFVAIDGAKLNFEIRALLYSLSVSLS
jgi:hypothetical protein